MKKSEERWRERGLRPLGIDRGGPGGGPEGPGGVPGGVLYRGEIGQTQIYQATLENLTKTIQNVQIVRIHLFVDLPLHN